MAGSNDIDRIHSFSPSWEAVLDEYRLDLEAAGRSRKYINWTLGNLRRFFSFIGKRMSFKSILDIGREEVREYIRFLQNAQRWPNRADSGKDLGKLSPFAIQGHVRSIKAFWGWLTREEYLGENPLVKLPLPKIPQYLVKTLTYDDIEKLLAVIDRTTALGAKYYSIVLLLLDTGIRIGELVNIKTNDLDIGHGLITILGKGKKQRVVPFYRDTRKELIRYIKNSRPLLGPEDSPYLFPKSDGEHVSINSVQQYMRRLVHKAGLDGIRFSPHVFRHTFATQAFANDARTGAVRDIMGHISEHTTLKYTHFRVDDLKAQHNRFSPVKHLLERKR